MSFRVIDVLNVVTLSFRQIEEDDDLKIVLVCCETVLRACHSHQLARAADGETETDVMSMSMDIEIRSVRN
jgi:hypothetical protein